MLLSGFTHFWLCILCLQKPGSVGRECNPHTGVCVVDAGADAVESVQCIVSVLVYAGETWAVGHITALARQDLSCTYLAHYELESFSIYYDYC